MSKNKRMIYVKPENIEFYDKLENKSEFINGALEIARLGGVDSLKVTEVADTSNPATGVSQTEGVHSAVEAMRERDAKRLQEWRKKQGLPDPTRA